METKKLLAQTLKALMTTTDLDHITIDKLAQQAHINRNTFYYHFADIHALLGWTIEQDVLQQLRHQSDIAHWQDAYALMLGYIEANQQFCLHTFHSLSRDLLEQTLFQQASLMVVAVVDSLDDTVSARLKLAIGDFYGWAIAAQVIQWLVNDLQESQESMIHKAELILDGSLAPIIARGQADPYFN